MALAAAGTALKGLESLTKVTATILSHVRERDVVIEVINKTEVTLTFLWDYHSSGRYETGPDKFIAPGEASVFSAENRTGNAEGAVGAAVYKIGTTNWVLCIYYSEPAVGNRKAGAYITNGDWHHAFRDHGSSGGKSAYESFVSGAWGEYVTESSNAFTDKRCVDAAQVTYSAGETQTYTVTKTAS